MNWNFESSSMAPPADLSHTQEGAHVVQFYDGDAFLLDALERYLGGALDAGDAALVIATRAHRMGLAARLRARGIDPEELAGRGQYVALDAGECLASVMVGGRPDTARFAEVVGGVIARVTSSYPQRPLRTFGEMVSLLYDEGNRAAAICLEELWNELQKKLAFSLVCAHAIHSFRSEADDDPFLRVCSQHSHVMPAEGYATLNDENERLRDITRLQRQASALDAEKAERKCAEDSLARSEEELRDLFENAAIGIQWVGPDTIILTANRAQLDLLGYTAEEYVGHHVAEFLEPSAAGEIVEHLGRGEGLRDHEARLRCKDGSYKCVMIDADARWREGSLVRSRCFVRDVTDRKLIERQREELSRAAEQARTEAEAAKRAKDEFLAMLGHELRNPLSAVRNAVVAARLDPTRRDRALDIAQRQIERLNGIVDDLLDVARITQGKIVLSKERVFLADIVRRAIDAVRPLLEERGQHLSLSMPEATIALDADPMRLEQVLMNLLVNAAKYGDAGNQISLRAEQQDGEAVMRVRDHGIGIDAEMLPRVFDLFAQADRSLDRAQGGLGIGLTIVKRLVELHGGRVEVHSDGLGRGAEFVVRLPSVRATPDTTGETALRERKREARLRANVLIVEDNVDCAESLAMLLQCFGHQVVAVHDGAAALPAARGRRPDVMLVDIGLPGMDGYEVARCVRGLPELKHVVLVALTGYGQEEDRRRATDAGFDYHHAKPIDPRRLEALIADAVETRKAPATIH
jgi:PAS domain S-box-containing protein